MKITGKALVWVRRLMVGAALMWGRPWWAQAAPKEKSPTIEEEAIQAQQWVEKKDYRRALPHYQRILQMAAQRPALTANEHYAVGVAHLQLMADAFDRALQAGLEPRKARAAQYWRDTLWPGLAPAKPGAPTAPGPGAEAGTGEQTAPPEQGTLPESEAPTGAAGPGESSPSQSPVRPEPGPNIPPPGEPAAPPAAGPSPASGGAEGPQTPAEPTPIQTIAHGQTVDLSRHVVRGKTTIFCFFSPHFPACLKLRAKWAQLAARRTERAVVEVDIDRPGQKETDWDSPVARQHQVNLLPAYKIYDAEGRLQAEGQAARDQVNQWLAELETRP